MTTYSSNSYLNQSQMTSNAQFILDFFIGQGWTKNAICGMLGNMQTESTINFGLYESMDNTSTTNGYGLVQWTPNTKYFDWANANGYANDNINGELQRILYEVTHAVQWIATTTYNFSFSDFTKSTETPEYLADAFLKNYERPANPNQPDRQTQARYWFDNLTTNGGSNGGGSSGNGGVLQPPSSTDTNTNIITLLMLDTLNGWKW